MVFYLLALKLSNCSSCSDVTGRPYLVWVRDSSSNRRTSGVYRFWRHGTQEPPYAHSVRFLAVPRQAVLSNETPLVTWSHSLLLAQSNFVLRFGASHLSMLSVTDFSTFIHGYLFRHELFRLFVCVNGFWFLMEVVGMDTVFFLSTFCRVEITLHWPQTPVGPLRQDMW